MNERVRFDFSDCRVLVTGGTSGIGAGIAHAFEAAGAEVTITGRRASASEYEAALPGTHYRALQMTDAGAIQALAESFPTLDVLVNNAGESLPGGRSEAPPDVFEESLRINLFGAYRLSTACQPGLGESALEGGASVINLASMSSYFGMPIVPGYGAAKAAVVQMTKTLAVTWARQGIRVNAIAPGLIESDMTAPLMDHAALAQPQIERTPMARWGTAGEVAPAVLFLASPAARFVTGQTLPVDGGYSIA